MGLDQGKMNCKSALDAQRADEVFPVRNRLTRFVERRTIRYVRPARTLHSKIH